MLYFSKVYNYLADFRVNFKKSFKLVFAPKIFKLYLILTLVWQMLAWYISVYVYRNLSGRLLILHYNVDFGTDLIGAPIRVFGGPLFALLIFIVNAVFALSLNRRQAASFLNHLLIAGAMVLNLFVLIALFTIYLSNFR